MSHLEHPELSRQEEKEIKDAFIAFNERKLHVVTCISNPVRFKSRYKLYHEFAHRMKNEPGVIFWTIELAFGNRPFEVTDANNPYHMQVRSSDELWHKENLINVLVNSKIPNDGFPIAVIDADVAFMNPNWVNETIEQLEHYDVVQMFKECIDFGPSYNLVSKECHVGVAYSFTKGIPPARWVDCGYDTFADCKSKGKYSVCQLKCAKKVHGNWFVWDKKK